MYAGIDFGTSNCAIGVWQNNLPRLLILENRKPLIASTLYTSRAHVTVAEIDRRELADRVAAARRAQRAAADRAGEPPGSARQLPDSELESLERGIMRRELAERAKSRRQTQTLNAALNTDGETLFGEAAIERHLLDPREGYFIKSPKSFLGAELKQSHIDLFAEIITRMLANIKSTAESQTDTPIDSVVLGKPVNFHGQRGAAGNSQALGILEGAALAAGFGRIEFLYEPIAAALDYERSLTQDRVVMVLDAGGGTTDCSMVRVGPSFRDQAVRDASVLGYAGDRVGGTDIDIKLAIRNFMPHFGKDTMRTNGLPVPGSMYWDAVSINDVNAQARFAAERTGREISQLLREAVEKEKVDRLLRLYRGKFSYRLNRSAELAKIQLSDRAATDLTLDYIDSDLAIHITRQDLKAAVDSELSTFVDLVKDVERQSQTRPEVIYVTGGTAKSPLVEERLRSEFPDANIVVGDLFGSVASGLTTWAHRIFR